MLPLIGIIYMGGNYLQYQNKFSPQGISMQKYSIIIVTYSSCLIRHDERVLYTKLSNLISKVSQANGKAEEHHCTN